MSDGQEVAAWHNTTRHQETIHDVKARLALLGGVTELRVIEGMSAQELDVLVERERR